MVVSTHLKKYARQIGFHVPKDRGEHEIIFETTTWWESPIHSPVGNCSQDTCHVGIKKSIHSGNIWKNMVDFLFPLEVVMKKSKQPFGVFVELLGFTKEHMETFKTSFPDLVSFYKESKHQKTLCILE